MLSSLYTSALVTSQRNTPGRYRCNELTLKCILKFNETVCFSFDDVIYQCLLDMKQTYHLSILHHLYLHHLPRASERLFENPLNIHLDLPLN